MVLTVESCEFATVVNLDARILLDALDQIARHCLRETVRPHQHLHASAALRQEHRRLTCRVATADHNYSLLGAELCFHERGAVINAPTGGGIQVWERRPVVLRSHSEHNRARGNVLPTVKLAPVRTFVADQA